MYIINDVHFINTYMRNIQGNLTLAWCGYRGISHEVVIIYYDSGVNINYYLFHWSEVVCKM